MISFSRPQNIVGQIILAALILANVYWLHNLPLGLILGAIYLWLNSRKLGDIFFTNIHQGFKNLAGLLMIFAYISLIYTIAYHLYQINIFVWLFSFLSISIIVEFLSYYLQRRHYFLQTWHWYFLDIKNLRKSLLPTIFIVLDILIFIFLLKKASTGIIRSPWELLSYKFWAAFALSNLCLVASLVDKRSDKNIFFLVCHFFMLASFALILYPLGYGYDSFIHAATIKVIADTGTIEPRLFLYVGQYGLTFFIHYLTNLSLFDVNRLLMPFCFAVFWPTSIFYGLRYGFKWSFKTSYLATLWSTALGFNFAIMTTPQNLTYLWFVMIIFLLPEINKKNIPLFFPWAITVMTMTMHPLAGLPLLFLSTYLSVAQIKKHKIIKKLLVILTTLAGIISLPLFFALYQHLSGIPWNKIFTISDDGFNLAPFNWYHTYSFPLDALHNIGANFIWIYAIVSALGLYFILKEHKYVFFKKLLFLIIVLIINYFIASLFLSFNLQISYQKNDYPDRLAYLVVLAVLPIFLTSVYFWWQKVLDSRQEFWPKIFLIVLTTIIIISGTYFSYPVYDRHQNSKSFNVTATDLKTVDFIDNQAQGASYIVLANQMVGAAAIQQFGFAHYYNNNFYYSMPLGINNIYQDYLVMVEENASREAALTAMDKAGVNKLYLVINNYWHTAKVASAQADESANEKWLIDNGVNSVFLYTR